MATSCSACRVPSGHRMSSETGPLVAEAEIEAVVALGKVRTLMALTVGLSSRLRGQCDMRSNGLGVPRCTRQLHLEPIGRLGQVAISKDFPVEAIVPAFDVA